MSIKQLKVLNEKRNIQLFFLPETKEIGITGGELLLGGCNSKV